ncbi:MAG: sugar transferase [bacterium]
MSKRVFDLLVCLVALPLLLPLACCIAAAVSVSSRGPVFFRQERTGANGRKFTMYKFRTMVRNATQLRAQLAGDVVSNGPDFKMVNDPRVTRVGAFLRKTSLDELPQLWNVVRGDMSLVGPRPTSFGSETYALWHTERLEAKPGLTGLWQIEKRGDLDFDERVRLDIAYLRNRSLRLDLWILLRTVPAVLEQRGAY